MSPDRIPIQEAARMLGYASTRSVWRLVKAGRLRPLPTPLRPRHFRREDVAALANGTPRRGLSID
ncbi:MAG: helix-turn-helix domain-containing protein [Opitutales bacterium]|nr:helix-turn-helix domain-containing protein [Opitutales bacterium]